MKLKKLFDIFVNENRRGLIEKTKFKLSLFEIFNKKLTFDGIQTNEIRCTFFLCCIILLVTSLIQPVTSERIAIWKCCFKGEQLHRNGRDCISRSTQKIDPFSNVGNESTLRLATDRPDDLYWLPPELKKRDLSVSYVSTVHCNKFLILESNDTSRISFAEDMNVTYRSLDGSSETIIEPADYCLDASDGPKGPWVIRLCSFERITHVVKCCPQRQVIKDQNGNPDCVEDLNFTMNGPVAIKNLNTDLSFAYNSYSLCSLGKFQTLEHPNITTGFMEYFLAGKPGVVDGLMWRYMCLDAQVKPKGDVKWTLGYCAFRLADTAVLNASAYLGLAAAVLLAVSVVVTLTHKQSRGSTHGRALVCHAGSLLVAYAVNAVFTIGFDSHMLYCQELALTINFFLLASAFWLQIICFNMTRGFSQMLRANPRIGRKKNGIKIFCFYSLYGWGCPTIATIIIVCTLTDYIFSSPLYHTKTCFFEEGHISRTRKLNSFFYYYAPICIILMLNIGMFGFSAFKIRMMQKGTTILHQKGDGQPSGTRRSAVLYVKLLLAMGVLEAAVDVLAWAFKDSSVRGPEGERITDWILSISGFLQREFTYRWCAYALDFLRAASIFAVSCCGQRSRQRARMAFASCLARVRMRVRNTGGGGVGGDKVEHGGKHAAGQDSGDGGDGGSDSGKVRHDGDCGGGGGEVKAADGGSRGSEGTSGGEVCAVGRARKELCSGSDEDDGSRGPGADSDATRPTDQTSYHHFFRTWMRRVLVHPAPTTANEQQRPSVDTTITLLDEDSRRFSASST